MLKLDTRQIYHFTPVSALLSAQKSVELGTVSENLAVSGLMGRWKPAYKISESKPTM